MVFSAIVLGLFVSVYFCIKQYIKHGLIYKIVAHPTERSVHTEKMPTSGGIIFGGFHLVAILITYFILPPDIRCWLLRLASGGFLILTLGLFDDMKNIKPLYKLFGQIIVTVIMFFCGFNFTHITLPMGNEIFLGHFSIIATIIWYLLVMNAINLIDGLDGLASGISIISCIVLLIYAYHAHNMFIIISCLYLIATLLPFLRYNFPNAKLFMGDSGSLYIGYILASIAIAGSETQVKGLTTFTILVPITVLFIPIVDTFFTIARRWKHGQPIFQADKMHLHHNLMNIGLSTTRVTLTLWLITIVFGILALGFLFLSRFTMMMSLIIFASLMLVFFFYIYKKVLLR